MLDMMVDEYRAEKEFWLGTHLQRKNKELWYV